MSILWGQSDKCQEKGFQSHLPGHSQKLQNTEDDSQAFFAPLKMKEKNIWATTPVKMDANNFKFCIFYSPKTQHRVLRQGRAVGIPTDLSQVKVRKRKKWWPTGPADTKRTYQHHDCGDQSCGFKHALQLSEWSHQETGAGKGQEQRWKHRNVTVVSGRQLSCPACVLTSLQGQRVVGSSPGCRPKRTPSRNRSGAACCACEH